MRRWCHWINTHINEPLAVRTTLIFGTMWVTYLFFAYGFLPLLFPKYMIPIMYWSSTVQLWALPLIMVGQNVLGRASERQAAQQFRLVIHIDQLTQDLHTMMAAQRDMLDAQVRLNEAVLHTIRQIQAKTDEIDAQVDALTLREDRTDGD